MSYTHLIPILRQGQTASHPAAGLDAGHPPVRSLYVHVPFCSHKCHYCDFYSFVDSQDRQEAFVDRLIDELRILAPLTGGQPLSTVFIGGGTPSLLRLDLWDRLLRSMRDFFDLTGFERAGGAGGGEPAGEWTVECNPESTTPELLARMHAGGVNRVSFGAQSFNPRHLKTLEREHDPERVPLVLDMAREAGITRSSIDLIFAIPGQTIDEVADDLATALSLATDHVSCYALTYEPNTPMTKRLERGDFEPVDEDTDAEMYELVCATLSDGGLDRYEISNFARPGAEARHNMAYWRSHQWLAAGPSASGHLWAGGAERGREGMRAGSHRWKNVPRLGDYLDSGGYAPVVDHETPDPCRAIRERLMMGLRLREGVCWPTLIDDGEHASPGVGRALEDAGAGMIDDGLASMAGDRLALTDQAMMLADGIASRLMGLVV